MICLRGKQRRQLTRSQKGANKYTWRVSREGGGDGEVRLSLDLTVERFQVLYEANETLAAARRVAQGEMNSAGQGFFLQEGFLYQYCEPPGHKGDVVVVEQLVLPGPCP